MGVLDDLESREDFSYDAESDPLYRQYRTQYRREGERAAEDVLADAATHAGGMNSYAVTAAQQAGDYYNAKLMDVLPELADLAYRRWQADYDDDLTLLKQLQSREKEAYNRYQDSLADWQADLAAAYRDYLDSEANRPEPDYIEQKNELAVNQWADVTEKDAVTELLNADYYQTAINAAVRGDRAGAEAALDKRAEKMESPLYRGNGGGTSMEEAYAYIESLLSGTEKAEEDTPRSTDGRTYDNGSLTRDQVRELQNYYEVEADGLWGKNSTAAAGGQTAEQAWEEYQRLVYQGAPSTGVDYDPESGAYRWNGRAYEDLAALEQGINSAGLTTAELEELARELNELGVSTEWVR